MTPNASLLARFLGVMGLAGCAPAAQPEPHGSVAPTGDVSKGAPSAAPTARASATAPPAAGPPYDIASLPQDPPSPGGGFCGLSRCEGAPPSAPLDPASAPFQRCGVFPAGAGSAPGALGGETFSPRRTAEAHNAGRTNECCYAGWTGCPGPMGGRAFRPTGGAPVVARGVDRDGWADRLAPAARHASLGPAWAADAAFEHASIASFSRLALDLLALGAPADLVRKAHLAALDELAHARATFGLSRAHGGDAGPRELSGAALARRASYAGLAREAFLDGCVGEAVAAVVALQAAAVCEDPVVAEVLARIGADESRHAELAFEVLAFAVRAGGAPAREALRDAMTLLSREASGAARSRGGPRPEERQGRLSPASVSAIQDELVREVVLPCARALLAGGSDGERDGGRGLSQAGAGESDLHA